jgi:hypothetical protein
MCSFRCFECRDVDNHDLTLLDRVPDFTPDRFTDGSGYCGRATPPPSASFHESSQYPAPGTYWQVLQFVLGASGIFEVARSAQRVIGRLDLIAVIHEAIQVWDDPALL